MTNEKIAYGAQEEWFDDNKDYRSDRELKDIILSAITEAIEAQPVVTQSMREIAEKWAVIASKAVALECLFETEQQTEDAIATVTKHILSAIQDATAEQQKCITTLENSIRASGKREYEHLRRIAELEETLKVKEKEYQDIELLCRQALALCDLQTKRQFEEEQENRPDKQDEEEKCQ